MQRLVCRYRRETMAGTHGHHEIRQLIRDALEQADLALDTGRRALVMGPTLPPGASSVDERCALTLRDPRDPHTVRQCLNRYLPDGVRVTNAWMVRPRDPSDDLARLDESVYQVVWRDAPPAREIAGRLQAFFARQDVELVRERDTKIQRLNARALVQQIRLGEIHPGCVRLLMVVSVGSRGTVRPDEVLQVLGYAATAEYLAVHRLALRQAGACRPAVMRIDAWRGATRGVPAPECC